MMPMMPVVIAMLRFVGIDAIATSAFWSALLIAVGVLDNLVKGAAGQAVQNFNLLCGLPETQALEAMPLWP